MGKTINPKDLPSMGPVQIRDPNDVLLEARVEDGRLIVQFGTDVDSPKVVLGHAAAYAFVTGLTKLTDDLDIFRQLQAHNASARARGGSGGGMFLLSRDEDDDDHGGH